MGRCCSGLLIAFRVIQLLLSLTVLAFGAWITVSFYTLSSAAGDLEDGINLLADVTQRRKIEQAAASNGTVTKVDASFVPVLQSVLIPVLQYFQSTPMRAIVITVMGLWSAGFIIFLYIAHRKAGQKPAMNRRRIRVTLELLTFFAWIGCVICAVMLTIQYGIFTLAGGAQMKLAFTALKPFLRSAVDIVADKAKKQSTGGSSIEVFDTIMTISLLSIVSLAASCICLGVSVISLFVSCCYSGKSKKGKVQSNDSDVAVVHAGPMKVNSGYAPVPNSPYPQWQATYTPTTPVPLLQHYYQDGLDTPASPASPPTYHYQGHHNYNAYNRV